MSSTMTATGAAARYSYAYLFRYRLISLLGAILLLHYGHLRMCLVNAGSPLRLTLSRWRGPPLLYVVRRNASRCHIHGFVMMLRGSSVAHGEEVKILVVSPARQEVVIFIYHSTDVRSGLGQRGEVVRP